MLKVIILVVFIATVALAAQKDDKLVRFELKKIPDREFVAGTTHYSLTRSFVS